MKYLKSLTTLVLISLCSLAYAQPSGTNYVRQSDFGDGQNSSYPNISSQWTFLNYWNDVQTLGTQTDWFGPNYQLKTSSHPHYVMLDDTPGDYGALAGRLFDLEYRLVEVNFDFITYNGRDSDLTATSGKLHVLLCSSENDVRGFDPSDPTQFETDGYGQVLMTINFAAGNTIGLDLNTWNTAGSSASRRAYALSKSQTGTPGNPFTYVGLVWESEFEETRLLLDNFMIVDVCPDCEIDDIGLKTRGCFENTWIGPIPNNYYYYSAFIRDSASNALIYSAIHQPAQFSWNGVGNTGTYNGVQIPFGQPMNAELRYYSCLRGQDNIVIKTYQVTRQAGCVDPNFGGNKVGQNNTALTISPNPVRLGSNARLALNQAKEEFVKLEIFDYSGRILAAKTIETLLLVNGGIELDLASFSAGWYIVRLSNNEFQYHSNFQIQ